MGTVAVVPIQKKKPHWTKSPEGKKKLAKVQKARWKKFHKLAKNGEVDGVSNANFEVNAEVQSGVLYTFGRVEQLIQDYASSRGISESTLAAGVADLLQRKARRVPRGN